MTKLNQLNFIALLLLAALSTHLWLKTRDLQQQLAAAHPVRARDSAVASAPPAPPLTHSRPWVKLPGGDSYFDFSGAEWSALTNAFTEKLESDSALRFEEGTVNRVSESRLKAMSNEGTVRTNAVWFFAPVTTNAPTNAPTPEAP